MLFTHFQSLFTAQQKNKPSNSHDLFDLEYNLRFPQILRMEPR